MRRLITSALLGTAAAATGAYLFRHKKHGKREQKLDQALDDSFPASDPTGVSGTDLG